MYKKLGLLPLLLLIGLCSSCSLFQSHLSFYNDSSTIVTVESKEKKGDTQEPMFETVVLKPGESKTVYPDNPDAHIRYYPSDKVKATSKEEGKIVFVDTKTNYGRIVGKYKATAWTQIPKKQNLLSKGGQIEITLKLDGTTVGHIFLPQGDRGGKDFKEDLAGTWKLEDDIVTFQHKADTFIRDMKFKVTENTLSGKFGEKIELVLTR